MAKPYNIFKSRNFNDTGIGTKRLPYRLLKPIVKFKTASKEVRKYHGKIDEALNVMSINGSVLQTLLVNGHLHVEKYEHVISLVQNNFLVASKIILLSKIFENILTSKYPTKDTVAIYSSTILYIIFASETIFK